MIKGENINLRVIRERDIDALFDLESDIETRGDFYPIDLTSESIFKSRFQKSGFWTEDFGRLLIVSKEDHILGAILYFKPVQYFDAFEIAYILYDVASRRKGYMTEALSLLTRYLFETKTVNRLQLTVITGNVASQKVAQKCGFTSEGILRQAIFQKGKHMDLEMFSLLREDVRV